MKMRKIMRMIFKMHYKVCLNHIPQHLLHHLANNNNLLHNNTIHIQTILHSMEDGLQQPDWTVIFVFGPLDVWMDWIIGANRKNWEEEENKLYKKMKIKKMNLNKKRSLFYLIDWNRYKKKQQQSEEDSKMEEVEWIFQFRIVLFSDCDG